MKLKKLASVLLAAVMAVSLATTAFAETPETQKGNITVTAKSSGRQLVAYRLFDSTKATKTDGTDTYGYSLNEKYKELISGVLADMGKSAADILETLRGLTNGEAETFAHDMQEKLSESNVTPEIGAGQTKDFTSTDNKDGTYDYKVEDVPLGYYIIFDTAEGSAEYAPTFAMLNPANTDVTVDAKDSTVTAGKTVDTDGEYKNTGNVDIGDTVTYKITGDIPAYASTGNDKYEVKLTDTLPDNGQLQYVEIKSVELSGDGIDNPFTAADVVFKDKNGQVTTDMTKAASFEFEKPVVDKENDIDYLNDKPATITITYTAKVVGAEKIVDENTNTYTYQYGDPDNLSESITKTATVYTYGFKILKQNENKEALAGAEFSLKKKGSDEALKFTKTDDNYVYDPVNGSTTLVSGEDGLISILGLDAGTYTLEETKAPDGYNLLANTIDVTITPKTKADIENADCTVSYKATGTAGEATVAEDYTINIENTTGTTLPGTGGMGTTLFTAGGLLILCAAGAFLYFNRKRLFSK